MLIYGHRGAPAFEPENTLRSFRRAIEAGVDGIELDVHATRDGVPVVMHDRDIRRTTNGSGAVDRLSLAELKGLDAGSGEKVPTLEEALREIGGKIHVDIEIKQGGIEPEVLALLSRLPDARWAISSFDWTVLERVRALSSSADLWLIATHVCDALFHTARHVGASAIALYSPALTADSMDRLTRADLKAGVWTVNDLAEAHRVQALGAYAVCTDDPGRIIHELRNAVTES